MEDAEVALHCQSAKAESCEFHEIFALQEQPYPDATALATAAWKGQVEKVKKLIKEGADVNERGLSEQKGFSPESPLQLAVDKASSFCEVPVRHLLLKSRRLCRVSVLVSRACMIRDTSALQGHYDVAKVLLELGADVNQRALDGSTPLIQSARTNKRGLTKLLLANGASCNGTNSNTDMFCTPQLSNGFSMSAAKSHLSMLIRWHSSPCCCRAWS